MYKLYSYTPINNFSSPLNSETSKFIDSFNKQTTEIYRFIKNHKNNLDQTMPWWFDKDTGNTICSGFLINPIQEHNSLCIVNLSLIFQSVSGGIIDISDILPAKIMKETDTGEVTIKSFFHISNSNSNYIGIDPIQDWEINISNSYNELIPENYFQDMINIYKEYLNKELINTE